MSKNNIARKQESKRDVEAYVVVGLVYSWSLSLLESMMRETLASQRTVSS